MKQVENIATTHIRFQDSMMIGRYYQFAALVLVGLIFAGCGNGNSMKQVDTSMFDDNGLKCSIAMQVFGEKTALVYEIRDSSLVRTLVLNPLNESIIDENPARYMILGELRINDADSETAILMFIPLGRVKINDEYRIVEFSLLQAQLEKWFERLKSGVFLPGDK